MSRSNPWIQSIIRHAAQALGGAPRFLTEEELAKMSPEAQRQLLDILKKLEAQVDNPSPTTVMKLIARGRIR